MAAPLPKNEAARLQALRETGLLDTLPEEEYESLVRLASVICETPIALVTLVDTDRQWFKAGVGLDASETSRDAAFCAHTILQSETFIVPDTFEDPRFAANPLVTGDPLIRFYAGVPLATVGGLRLGSLCVIDRVPRVLSSAQLEALELLGKEVNKLLDARRERNAARLVLPLDGAVEEQAEAGHGLFHAFMDNSPLAGYLKDDEGKIVYYNQRWADSYSISRHDWLGKTEAELWPEEAAAERRERDLAVLREWKTMVREEEAEGSEGVAAQFKSYSFPLRDSLGRQYVAGFAVDITEDREAQKEIRRHQESLEAANRKLHRLAVTDALTNLPNRRAFEAALEREFRLAHDYEHSLSLLLIDIDDFKFFNDTYGHEEGDRVLCSVAGVIAKSFRSSDSVARYGGEEFAVVLPNTPAPRAAESAERLRLAVAAIGSSRRTITISVGLSHLQDDMNKMELLRRADEALYQAKRGGKNRVCLG
jgi:diguanylate cyclase (GGDEF)-like protein/PAS domain S-box-containing protein